MKQNVIMNVVFLLVLNIVMVRAQANFNTSLHYTREGKNTAYRVENGGMQTITGIPMDSLTCQKCHSTTGFYPNGNPINPATYVPSCDDCHNFASGTSVAETTCLNCHNRQNYERQAYPGLDVHQNYGMTCLSCHTRQEIHGDDGIAYASLKEPGAIKVHCEDCHTPLPANSSHLTHNTKVDCAACHATSVLTCASCHFESLLASGKNRAINQLKNYRFLVKKDGEVRLGGFMTHTYNNMSNYIISSYHSHIIQKNATTCSDCHYNLGGSNVAIAEYNSTGFMTIATWDEGTKKIVGPSGVVPIPEDWKTALKVDYAVYNGDPNVFPSDPNAWAYLKSTTDNSHFFYAEPLDSATLSKLGFTRFPIGIVNTGNTIPVKFNLQQNYPNPFNPTTTISFDLPKTERVTLKVFDTIGREVETLINNETLSANTYHKRFNGEKLSSGVYILVLATPSYQQSCKMILMK